MDSTQSEMISMAIIADSGDAKSYAFNALNEAKKGNFELADELMRKSIECGNRAHKVQMDLLVSEANGDKNDINILLIHAQDHLMTSMLAQDLIQEIIQLYKNK